MPANYLGSATAVDMNGLLTHTMQKITDKKVIQDCVGAANPLFHELKKNGKIRTTADGGERLQINLLYGLNNTMDSYSRYDVLKNDPQDGMGVSYASWAQYAITISVDGLTLLQNAGAAKIKDLMASKIEQATITIADRFNDDLHDATNITASTGNSGKNIYALPMLIDRDVDRARDIQALSGNTYSWWRNQALDYGATHTATWFKHKMLQMYMSCEEAGQFGGAPDLILMGATSYENYEMSIEPQRRYTSSGKQTAGYEDLYYKKAKVFWDSKMQNWEDDGASSDDDTIAFINTKFMGLWVLGGRDWKWSPWADQLVNKQDAKQSTALWAGQLAVTNRRKHGVIFGVTDTPFA